MSTKLNSDVRNDSNTDTNTDTDDENRPTDETTRARRGVRLPTFGLSATQLIATGLAATTATFAASYLGVTGTVIGAALASMLTAVGNAVYGTSLRSTRDAVQAVVPGTRLPGRTTAALPRVVDEAPTLPSPDRATRVPAPVWRRAAFAAVGLFVVLMAVVTGVELVAGRPVSDVVRGDSGGGTSFFGHETVRTATTTVPPTAPTVYVTVTPKVVVTTPIVTQTAAPSTTTVTSPAAPTSGTSTGTAAGRTSGTPTTARSSASASAP